MPPIILKIISFLVRHGERFLHWNFVAVLLNDLFGIQARGGCACAGPYGHRLLNISPAAAQVFLLLWSISSFLSFYLALLAMQLGFGTPLARVSI